MVENILNINNRLNASQQFLKVRPKLVNILEQKISLFKVTIY